MKKVFLLLSVIGTVLLMTSCLGNTETYYSGSPLSYITTTNFGEIYAKSVDGFIMTSPEIKSETNPGDFVFINYSWKESENTVREDGIYNATISQISSPIEKSFLMPGLAPDKKETEPLLSSFKQALYGGSYFDYHWIFEYSYKKGDGNKKGVKFYYDPQEMTDDEIVVDIRLVDMPGTIEKDKNDVLVAVNFRDIHSHYVIGLTEGAQKNLRVYFRYYVKKSDGTLELFKMQQPYIMKIVKR